jgi:hypothetical protein
MTDAALDLWIGNPGTTLVLDGSSGTPLLARMARVTAQYFVLDDQQRFVSHDGSRALTAVAGASAPTLAAPSADPSQRWTAGADCSLVSGTGCALVVPPNAAEGQAPGLVPRGASGSAATWQLVSVPWMPGKDEPNEFLGLLPGDTFRITQASSGKVLAVITDFPAPAALVSVADDARQLWSYDAATQRLMNGKGRVLAPYWVGDALVVGGFTSNKGPYAPGQANGWVLTSGYIWNTSYWQTPTVKGDICLHASGDQAMVGNPPPFGDGPQRWVLDLAATAPVTPAPSLATDPAGGRSMQVTVTTSSAAWAGTSGSIHVSVMGPSADGTNPSVALASKIFNGTDGGSILQFSASGLTDAQVRGITEVRAWVETVSTLLWPWPVEDQWCVQSIKITVDTTATATCSSRNTWVGQTTVSFPVWVTAWTSITDGEPVDRALCSFEVHWPQYIIDCVPYVGVSTQTPYVWLKEMQNFPWGRSYDPTKIDGIGMLVGYIRGRLVGDRLKDQTSEILGPGKYTYAYSKTDDAMLYKFYSADGSAPANYVRHSQLGSGQEVIMAGEFVVTTGIDSVIAEVNNASGHYQPDNAACLYYVQRKLESLGIPVQSITWWTPS